MQVLVTGGAGYIGSVVTEELLRQGHTVVVYDNLSKGHRDAVVAPAMLVEADLVNVAALRRAMMDYDIEAVVHMAADSLVGESMTDPGKYYRNNLQAGLSLLDMMRYCRVSNLVFSSTAAVYGEPERQPIQETDTTHPTNTYGETKLAFERALYWYDRAHGLRYTSLRYFNAAGATERNGERHDPETHLIPSVLDVAAGRRADVTIFGEDYPTRDGTCVRDYIHVEDLAKAHVLALGSMATGKTSSRVYNLGGGGGYTVREVVDTAQRVTGEKIPVRVGPRRPGDPAMLVASSERIAAELNWHPGRQNLVDIIESAWSWMTKRVV
ncbi:MAG: UDP-glucose 4-epimerase GalE [Nitrospirales bacterium]|nr:UDP-glucose 4-epimerase GalE [Nitrospirales bacterium]